MPRRRLFPFVEVVKVGKHSPYHDCRLMHFYKPHSVSANHLQIATSYRYHTRYIALLPLQPPLSILLLSISRTPYPAVAPSSIRPLAFTFPYSTASQVRSSRVRMFGRSMLSTSLHCSSSQCGDGSSPDCLPRFPLSHFPTPLVVPPETAPSVCPLYILVPMSPMLPRPSYLASANHSSQPLFANRSSIPVCQLLSFDIGFPPFLQSQRGPLMAAKVYVWECRLPLPSSTVPFTLRS